MADRVLWTTQAEARDVTDLVQGIARDVNGNIDEERTDWDLYAAWWDRVDKALAKKYEKENKSAKDNHYQRV